MTGDLRVPSLSLVVDLKSVSMISCFRNGSTEAGRPKWKLYVWFQGATDICEIEIVDPEIFKEACEAIDAIGESNLLDTKWKNDLMIDLQAYLKKEDQWLESFKNAVVAIVKTGLMSHKPKTDIIVSIEKQFDCLVMGPGGRESLVRILKGT